MQRGISPRARAYIKVRAEDNMDYTCEIQRVGSASFDDADSIYTAGAPEVIYTGKCRIWEVNGGSGMDVNGETVVLQSTQLSIPFATTPVPKRDDEVKITAAPLDPHMVGKRFRIMDVAKGGDLRPSRRFTVQHIQEDS